MGAMERQEGLSKSPAQGPEFFAKLRQRESSLDEQAVEVQKAQKVLDLAEKNYFGFEGLQPNYGLAYQFYKRVFDNGAASDLQRCIAAYMLAQMNMLGQGVQVATFGLVILYAMDAGDFFQNVDQDDLRSFIRERFTRIFKKSIANQPEKVQQEAQIVLGKIYYKTIERYTSIFRLGCTMAFCLRGLQMHQQEIINYESEGTDFLFAARASLAEWDSLLTISFAMSVLQSTFDASKSVKNIVTQVISPTGDSSHVFSIVAQKMSYDLITIYFSRAEKNIQDRSKVADSINRAVEYFYELLKRPEFEIIKLEVFSYIADEYRKLRRLGVDPELFELFFQHLEFGAKQIPDNWMRPLAQLTLAKMYRVDLKREQALSLLQLAIAQDSNKFVEQEAALILAKIYYLGLMGQDKDYDLAFTYVKKAQGLPEAHLLLGDMYIRGLGVEKNFEQAQIHLTKALMIDGALRGRAYIGLGAIYYHGGFGIEKDLEKAKIYFEQFLHGNFQGMHRYEIFKEYAEKILAKIEEQLPRRNIMEEVD